MEFNNTSDSPETVAANVLMISPTLLTHLNEHISTIVERMASNSPLRKPEMADHIHPSVLDSPNEQFLLPDITEDRVWK